MIKSKLSNFLHFSRSPSLTSVHCLLFILLPLSPLLDICSFCTHRWRRRGSLHMYLPSSPLCLLPYIQYSLFSSLSACSLFELLFLLTYIPSLTSTLAFFSSNFCPFLFWFHHLIDRVYTCFLLLCPSLQLLFFPLLSPHCFIPFFFYRLYLSTPSSVSPSLSQLAV